ncbi:MAG TPA: hypothetical protein VGE35_04400 [Candidatus Paceibacterota bacterium]
MKRLIPLFVLAAFLVPALSFAQPGNANQSTQGRANQTGPSTPIMSTLQNPLKVSSLEALYKDLLNTVIQIGYIVVAFFLLLSGFKFVTAQGSESKLEEAKSTFYGTIIGAIIVVGAHTITAILESVVKSLK